MKKMKNYTKRNAKQQNPWVLLLMGFVLLGVSYGAASWAIDNGRVSLYVVTFLSLFFALRSLANGTKLLTRK